MTIRQERGRRACTVLTPCNTVWALRFRFDNDGITTHRTLRGRRIQRGSAALCDTTPSARCCNSRRQTRRDYCIEQDQLGQRHCGLEAGTQRLR